MKKKPSAKTGQTLVEFALIFPVFILLVMFIFDIGRGVYYYSVLYNAVREGARFAVVGDPNSNATGIKDKVIERAYGLDLDPGEITVIWSNPNTPPVIVTVGAEYDYDPITPFIAAFLPGNSLTIDVEATMRLEFE